MDRILLSLKTIYMLMMAEDFPIYSESVIGRTDRKGQTMLRFWQGHIAEEFRSQPCGRLIWRTEVKRNRYTSYLCNRSSNIKIYTDYARELAAQCNPAALDSQIRCFEVFLSGKQYRHEILLRRVQELTRLARGEDPHFSAQIAEQLLAAAKTPPQPGGTQEKLFQAAYLLTLLTLYAAAGEAMDAPGMAALRAAELSMEALWQSRQQRQTRIAEAPQILTAHTGLLQNAALPRDAFFGREEALYDVAEMAAEGKKCLVCGIGGIGKTELLRQLIRQALEAHSAEKLAVIPYCGGLAESFQRAFPALDQTDPEANFREALALLHREAQSSCLLVVIDDISAGPEEDPALAELASLPCAVVASSRRPRLEGFQAYPLSAPAPSAGALIFRANYGRPLTEADRRILGQLVKSETFCHPLTLRLMARATRCREWSLEELAAHLEKKNIPLTWVEEDQAIRLNKIYSQLYSILRIPEEYRQIAELFTLLPRGSYSAPVLEGLFPTVMANRPAEPLAELTAGGWLELGEDGYSMHPLIAQCLGRKVLTEAKAQFALAELYRLLPDGVTLGKSTSYSWQAVRGAEILLNIAQMLAGPVSRRLLMAVLTAVNMGHSTYRRKQQLRKLLGQLRSRCPERDALDGIIYSTTTANWHMAEARELLETFQAARTAQNVPRALYLDFCLTAGSNLIFLQKGEAAVEVLREVLCAEATPLQTATAYYHIAGCCLHLGRSEDALHWAELAAAYVREHPDCGEMPTFFNMSMTCDLYIKFDRQASAQTLLEELSQQVREDDSPIKRIKYANLMGQFARKYGQPEDALTWLEKQCALTTEYYGKDRNYYSLLIAMADTLQKLGRYAEAEERFREVLDHAQASGDGKLLAAASNDYAAMLLQRNKPEKALELLRTAEAVQRRLGGVMLADGLRRTADALRMLDDRDGEYRCLQEALPLLEQAYGPGHPNAEAPRARLTALDKVKKE